MQPERKKYTTMKKLHASLYVLKNYIKNREK